MDAKNQKAKSSFFFSFERSEYKKVFFLAILKFSVSFIYDTLTLLKEPLAALSGVEGGMSLINAIKGAGVFPASLAFVLLYTRLSNHYTPARLFYGICFFFLSFLLLYAFVLYPNDGLITPRQRAAGWLVRFPQQRHWIAFVCEWPHVLFFIFAELWGQVAIFILYWGTVSELCTIHEAKRMYPLFIMAGCLGGALAMLTSMRLNTIYTTAAGYATVVRLLVLTCSALLFGIMLLYTIIRKTTPNALSLITKEQREAPSLWSSIVYIVTNPNLLAIATMVIACSVCMGLVDVSWREAVRALYSTPYL